MTIKIEDNIDDLTAVSLVKQVIEQGKISNNGNSYCYLSILSDICVETRQHRKSPCFRVYKKWVMENKEENKDKCYGCPFNDTSCPGGMWCISSKCI